MRLRVPPLILIALLVNPLAEGHLRYPRLERLQIRIEMHLLPAVSSGPLDPAWSPDGAWIAFSMRGDVWKVPAAGGEAVALTKGPGYHFEPAWSPDGRQLALSVDLDGNLDIGVVSADGGPVERLTTDAHVDVQPVWSPDGQGLYFVSGRSGTLGVYRLDLGSRAITPVTAGPGHRFHPAISPDGRHLAYVGAVEGRLGTGGLWIMPLPSGQPVMAHYEETNFRAKPAWTRDGSALVYVTDVADSNDLAVVPVEGGNPIRLTWDAMDEYAPAISPDGSRIAYVSNHAGPTTLMIVPMGGGQGRPVSISARRPRQATGRLRGRALDAAGRLTPARIHLVAADGRAYVPDGAFHRVISESETHYFATDGAFEVEVPAGPVDLEALKGFEYAPATGRMDVPAGGSVDIDLTLHRVLDAPRQGWYSGDTHLHDLHAGRWGLSDEDLRMQIEAEDLRVANFLVHMDDTRVMGRWRDVIGRPHPLSTADTIISHGEEFRGSLGHVGLLGLKSLVLPVLAGVPTTAYSADVLALPQLDAVREQGGIGGFLHPYNFATDEPAAAANAAFPIDLALGRGDFYDVVAIWSDELGSAQMYYRFLNSGFRLAATGGSDTPSNVWRAPPPGTARTYARVAGPLSLEGWLDAVRAGRTFATNGPLLFLEVDDRQPGDEIRLDADAPAALRVRVDAQSRSPLEKVEILVNGTVVHTIRPDATPLRIEGSHTVTVPGSGWVAARALGPAHRYVADAFAFAQTSPVHIVRQEIVYRAAEDARFLREVVDLVWKRVETRNRWRSVAEKEAFRQHVERARAFYDAIVADGSHR